MPLKIQNLKIADKHVMNMNYERVTLAFSGLYDMAHGSVRDIDMGHGYGHFLNHCHLINFTVLFFKFERVTGRYPPDYQLYVPCIVFFCEVHFISPETNSRV